VLDHAGPPDVSDMDAYDWSGNVRVLADTGRVACKLRIRDGNRTS
jgi:predicted TIM-barrel fold metal-dependent hydrolase